MSLKKWSIFLTFLFIATALGGKLCYEKNTATPQLSLPSLAPPEVQPIIPTSDIVTVEPPTEIPDTFSLPVPFTAQAPTGNWDDFHKEACEETSALMAAAYFSGDTHTVLSTSEVEKQLTLLTHWQEQHFGYSLDTNAEETAEMIRSVYHLNTHLIHNFTFEDIRLALLADTLIVLPLNGRALGNPYFHRPGPIYHMVVVRGYTQTNVITNDPGTKHGENYPYSFTTIENATANWNHNTNTIDTGTSVMIVVSK